MPLAFLMASKASRFALRKEVPLKRVVATVMLIAIYKKSRMLVKHFGIVPLLALALLAGCAFQELNKQKAETLDLQRAKDFQKAGRYDLAIEKFEAIKNKYPLSPEAIEAELEIAESYYLQGSYVESLAYFQSFHDLHPNYKKVDFASFRVGMSYYKQIPSTIDRDLSAANKTIEAFNEFLDRYPRSSYVTEAKAKKQDCFSKLAQKEYYIGDFYYRQKQYSSAAGRFKTILKKYSGLSLEEKVLFQLGMCYYYLNEKAEAKKMLSEFVKQFPNSKQVSEANAVLKKN